MIIRFHRNFDKSYKKLKISENKKIKEKLLLFIQNPYHPLLNNHPLKGKYLDYRSINISGDLRAIYKLVSDNEVIFVEIDSHSNLYK
jgi:mRNA interferase YafQ